tara:strand:- start:285 stop:572 length:288 start_codon:yes stop_codon:yes gene_type:complete
MAAVTVTYDNDPVRRVGNLFEIHGTIEVDTTATAYAVVDDSHHIVAANLSQEDGTFGSLRLGLNLAANYSTSTPGSIAVDSDAAVGTVRFAVQYA